MIHADPPEIRRKNRMVNTNLFKDPDAEEEQFTAICFLRWNSYKMLIDPIMIVYWLKCIFKQNCCKTKDNILYLWSKWKNYIEINR